MLPDILQGIALAIVVLALAFVVWAIRNAGSVPPGD
jgi:nitrogen fixation-related uncharacterized protein